MRKEALDNLRKTTERLKETEPKMPTNVTSVPSKDILDPKQPFYVDER